MLIAQLTDLHIKADGRLAYGQVDTAGALRLAIDKINAIRPKIDVVMITGDIVDGGSAQEYAFARPLLDALEPPWFPLPGNHDAREPFQAAFADRLGGAQKGAFVHYAIEDYPIRMIAIDSTVPDEPYGRLCAVRLEWLDDMLRAGPDRPTLLFLHHPPFETGIRHMDVQNLRNSEALLSLTRRHEQVRHIACGHVHRAVDTVVQGVSASIAPAPAHAVDFALGADAPPSFTLEPAMLRIFHALDDALVSHLVPLSETDGPHPFFDNHGRFID